MTFIHSLLNKKQQQEQKPTAVKKTQFMPLTLYKYTDSLQMF